ncbi:hypothetical protein CBS101457_000839 [Exobasidium rhododendri]|nr:hypothetical protein CBS101457_000839 [Exobasidium rhododendri]
MTDVEAAFSMNNDRRLPDSAEMVGIKDGVGVAAASNPMTDMIALSIKCPSLPDFAAESTLVSVPSNASIAEVKLQIEGSWSGRPQAHGMRMFKLGQLLTDDTIVGDIVPLDNRGEPLAIHLVIRPTAWTEPRPTLLRRQTSSRAGRPPPSPHEAWVEVDSSNSAASTSAPSMKRNALHQSIPAMYLPQRPRHSRQSPPERHLANVLEKMDPSNYTSFRSLLTWSYYRYVELYEDKWKEVYGHLAKEPDQVTEMTKSVEQLAKEMDCTTEEIMTAVELVETEVLMWKPIDEELLLNNVKHSEMTYKAVTLQGLPYLLQTKRDACSGPLIPLMKRIKYLQETIHRMDKLINYQNLFDQATNTTDLQATLRRSHAAMLAAAAAVNAGGARATGRNGDAHRHRVRVVFNMTEFVNIAIPAFLMSLKMTLLVYIFTRGATTFKACMIAGAGLIFVILQAWKTAQQQEQRRRQEALRERQRRNPTTNPSPAQTTATSSSPSNEQGTTTAAEEDTSLESLRPRVSTRHQSTSPLTFDYWIETLAYVGLASEDDEFGWQTVPSEHRGSIGASAQRRLVKRATNWILMPMLLMVVTLLPEIEQKRRKAIEAREELVRSVAKKVEERKARFAENVAAKAEKGGGVSSSPASSSLATTMEEVPYYLKHSYCQRIIHQRRVGRQIDIAQELEAAAAAAEWQGADQADMGFL